jgi:tetratricopeptide (TPR) repeat protein
MRSPSFVLVLGLAFLGLALVTTPALSDKRVLQGKLVFVDAQDRQAPAVGLDIVCEETGESDTTGTGGLFKIPLPDVLLPRDRITLRVHRTHWRIWQPPAGEVAVPARAHEKKVVTVKLLEAGATRLLNEAAVERLLLDAASKSKEQVEAGGRPAEIQVRRYLDEWAMQYGFAREEVEAEVDRWIAAARANSDDPRRLALAEFAKNDFERASALAAQWAASAERRQRQVGTGKQTARSDAVQAYRLAGDAQYNDYRFETALEFYRKALALSSARHSPTTWAAIQDDVGRAAWELGTRAQGEAAWRHLDESIAAHQAALQARTRALPQQWAGSQNSLGRALQQQGSRNRSEAGQVLLAQAVEAYRAALEVYTRPRSPQRWATIQNSLGSVLQERGNRSPGEAGRMLLVQAEEAYRAALEVYTRQRTPQLWATIQNSLATALQDRANRSPGEAGEALLAQAVEAYRAALEVYTRQRTPQHWASIQNSLGTALEEAGKRSQGEAGEALQAQAAQAYAAASEVSARMTPLNLQYHMDSNPTAGF